MYVELICSILCAVKIQIDYTWLPFSDLLWGVSTPPENWVYRDATLSAQKSSLLMTMWNSKSSWVIAVWVLPLGECQLTCQLRIYYLMIPLWYQSQSLTDPLTMGPLGRHGAPLCLLCWLPRWARHTFTSPSVVKSADTATFPLMSQGRPASWHKSKSRLVGAAKGSI